MALSALLLQSGTVRISAADLQVQTNSIFELLGNICMCLHTLVSEICMTMSVKDLNKRKIIYLDA